MQDTPIIRLAGRDWPAPKLAIKQMRVVVPGLVQLLPRIAEIQAGLAQAAANTDSSADWLGFLKITPEDFDNISNVVYTALTKGTPGLARAEFDNLEIDIRELFEAIPVIVGQTGAFTSTPAEVAPEGGAKAGG